MKKRLVSLVLVLLTLLALSSPAYANNSKIVALTFDDGPSWKYTPGLLDALAERGAKATFFLVGYCLEVNMELAERTFNEGHQLANHSYSHTWFTKLSAKAVKEEIDATNELLSEITGETDFLVRVPYGSMNGTVKKAVETSLIQWSVDPANGRSDMAEATMVRNLLNTVRDGSIIILHDTNQKNVNVAIKAVDALLEEGYEFVTLNELFRLRGIGLENGGVYYSAPQSGGETEFDESLLEEHWAYESIQLVMEKGIILGDNEGFKPNEYLSRAMASTVLMRLATATNKVVTPISEAEYTNIFEKPQLFADVPADLWFSKAIIWARSNSYILGVDESLFDPYSYITKEQFYTILARFAEKEFAIAASGGVKVSYRDDARISPYAQTAVALIRNTGFCSLNDPEIFRPGDNITRAEAAELVAFTLNVIESQQIPRGLIPKRPSELARPGQTQQRSQFSFISALG